MRTCESPYWAPSTGDFGMFICLIASEAVQERWLKKRGVYTGTSILMNASLKRLRQDMAHHSTVTQK